MPPCRSYLVAAGGFLVEAEHPNSSSVVGGCQKKCPRAAASSRPGAPLLRLMRSVAFFFAGAPCACTLEAPVQHMPRCRGRCSAPDANEKDPSGEVQPARQVEGKKHPNSSSVVRGCQRPDLGAGRMKKPRTPNVLGKADPKGSALLSSYRQLEASDFNRRCCWLCCHRDLRKESPPETFPPLGGESGASTSIIGR
jgi:hypothetical protein